MPFKPGLEGGKCLTDESWHSRLLGQTVQASDPRAGLCSLPQPSREPSGRGAASGLAPGELSSVWGRGRGMGTSQTRLGRTAVCSGGQGWACPLCTPASGRGPDTKRALNKYQVDRNSASWSHSEARSPTPAPRDCLCPPSRPTSSRGPDVSHGESYLKLTYRPSRLNPAACCRLRGFCGDLSRA